MDNFATTTVTESTEIAGNAMNRWTGYTGLSKAGPMELSLLLKQFL